MKKPVVEAARGRTCSRKSFFFRGHLSRAASLPGAELLAEIDFFEEATCPGQLRCLGQNLFSKNRLFGKKPLVPGSFAAWGRFFFRILTLGGKSYLSRAASLPGAELFPEIFTFLGRSHLSRAASLPGAELFSRNLTFGGKEPLVPGIFAAWGRFFPEI